RVDRLQVGAGAEDRAFLPFGVGGEDADPHLGIGIESVDGRLESGGDVAVDGVARLRTVQRDDRDATTGLVLHDLVGDVAHDGAPCSSSGVRGWSVAGVSAAGDSATGASGTSVAGTSAAGVSAVVAVSAAGVSAAGASVS